MYTNTCKHTYARAARAPTRTHKHANPNTRTNWATHACIHRRTNWATHVDFRVCLKREIKFTSITSFSTSNLSSTLQTSFRL